LFLSGKGHPMPFRKENVEKHYREILRIVP